MQRIFFYFEFTFVIEEGTYASVFVTWIDSHANIEKTVYKTPIFNGKYWGRFDKRTDQVIKSSSHFSQASKRVATK